MLVPPVVGDGARLGCKDGTGVGRLVGMEVAEGGVASGVCVFGRAAAVAELNCCGSAVGVPWETAPLQAASNITRQTISILRIAAKYTITRVILFNYQEILI